MTDKIETLQRIECRLVLIEAQSMRILTTAGAADSLLPRESIPAHTRVAESLTDAIEKRYSFSTIQLALFHERAERSYCAVHETIGSIEASTGSLCLTALDQIASSELDGEEREIVFKIMTGKASGLGRFARVGWIDELLAITASYQDRSSPPIIRHLNQGINFCLLTMEDDRGRRLWFKAAGEPNACEYALTAELARRFPLYLPRVLATIPKWNGWVMEDVKGLPLNETGSIYQCKQALTTLAVMQQETASDVTSLLALGAKDWTCTRIATLFEAFFRVAPCAMEAQTSAKSKPLSRSELYQLQRDMELTLDEFIRAGIPETLLHGDIGHGNIIATCGGPVFLDWAETYIGHPFLSAEHLLADLARSNSKLAEEQATLRSHYAGHWKAHTRTSDLERVVALAPAIAAFAYAVIAWEASCNRADPTEAWPLIRSMLRRTKRELDQLPECIA